MNIWVIQKNVKTLKIFFVNLDRISNKLKKTRFINLDVRKISYITKIRIKDFNCIF